MHIANGLGCYWLEKDKMQIGLDPRRAIGLTNLSISELEFVSTLTRAHAPIELERLAHARNISSERSKQIITQLETAGICIEETSYLADGQASWRIRNVYPKNRHSIRVEIPRLDQLGCAIALLLAEAGINAIASPDENIIGEYDHFALRNKFFGLKRRAGLTTLLREINPRINLSTKEKPHLAIITGSHAIDPLITGNYFARDIDVLTCWVEEIDIVVGPLNSHFLPNKHICNTCLYLYKKDANPQWDKLAIQAFSGRTVIPEINTLHLAATLAVREIINFIDYGSCHINTGIWQIRPTPELPTLKPKNPHPHCNNHLQSV